MISQTFERTNHFETSHQEYENPNQISGVTLHQNQKLYNEQEIKIPQHIPIWDGATGMSGLREIGR